MTDIPLSVSVILLDLRARSSIQVSDVGHPIKRRWILKGLRGWKNALVRLEVRRYGNWQRDRLLPAFTGGPSFPAPDYATLPFSVTTLDFLGETWRIILCLAK